METNLLESRFTMLEKFIRHKLYNLNKEITEAYDAFNFHRVFQMILNFCSQELSALFFDIRKDALYCDKNNSLNVRSSKTVMTDVFDCLIRRLAPIIPFTTEEAWQCWKEDVNKNSELSCHLLENFELPDEWNDYIKKLWDKINRAKGNNCGRIVQNLQ